MVSTTIAVAERYHVVVDFSKFSAGTKRYFVNTIEHKDGKVPKDVISLKDILSG